MDRATSMTKKLASLIALTFGLIVSGGCTLSPAHLLARADRYYLIDIPECKLTTKTTDAKIVECKEIVRSVLRERFNNARLARTTGGTLQVLTSAVSAMLTGINGASAVTAATVLSGTSSIMPELSNVIEAKDRAEVYSEGLKAIENGEARYLKAVANKFGGKIDDQKVTSDGAELYDTVFAAVHVVEARLAALLPSVDELQKLRAVSETIEIAPAIVSLTPGPPSPTAKIQVIHGGPVGTASSDKAAVASVKLLPGEMVAEIEAGKVEYGSAIITLTNSRGGRGTVRVRVEKEPLVLEAYSLQLNMKNTKTGDVNRKTGGTIKSVQSSDDKVAKAKAGPKGASVNIEAVGEGNATITVENESERSVAIEVTVTK